MADAFPRFERGDTRQFVAIYSAAPTTPVFNMWAGSGMGTLIYSSTAAASSTTQFYAMFTFPDTARLYMYEWVASFSPGPMIFRGYARTSRGN